MLSTKTSRAECMRTVCTVGCVTRSRRGAEFHYGRGGFVLTEGASEYGLWRCCVVVVGGSRGHLCFVCCCCLTILCHNKRWLTLPVSFILAWDWHYQRAESDGVSWCYRSGLCIYWDAFTDWLSECPLQSTWSTRSNSSERASVRRIVI